VLPARRWGCAVAALSLAACGDEGLPAPAPVTSAPPLPWAAEVLPPAPEPADNPGTPAKVELGRNLFYDPVLSSDGKVACATCHSEIWGMSDGLSQSIGVGGTGPTGPGRVGPTKTRRNAQTLWNVAYREALFWDGRAATLEEQALAPLHATHELGRDPAAVVAQLGQIPAYVKLFEAAFPEASPAVSVESLARALSAFERSMVTDRASYDHYVRGDEGALSETSKRGMFLFGDAGCAGCHVPPTFDSPGYADRRVPGIVGVRDPGREGITHDAADHDGFRVPTLRNLRETGPYFHTGAVDTLEDAVRHEAGLAARPLGDDEVHAIATFLDKWLVDPSRSPSRPAHVPSGLPVPLDGFRIPR
jgi:cytochrome c peroxidase